MNSRGGGDSARNESCPLRPGKHGTERPLQNRPGKLVAVGLVEAARLWGGQSCVHSRTKPSHCALGRRIGEAEAAQQFIHVWQVHRGGSKGPPSRTQAT